MGSKIERRAAAVRLPSWAHVSLGLYLVLTLLYPLVGRAVHGLTLYLLPVIIAARGGIGPGFAMIAAALVTQAAIDLQLLGSAVSAIHYSDSFLFVLLGTVLVSRSEATQRHLNRYRRESEAARELLRFARHTGNPTDLPLLLRSVADVGSNLLRAEYGAVFIWDPQAKQFRAAQQSSLAEQRGVRFTGITLPAAGSPVIAQLVRERAPLSVDDARRTPEWAQVVRDLPVSRALLIPASSWGRTMGCLLFGRGPAGTPFGARERRLGVAMAENVALALEYAEAFQALERQADQIRRLNLDLENRNARLVQLEQLRKDLGQMIVHDMRSPLTAVIAAMRWVDREAGATLAAGPAEANRVGLRSAEELLQMVNELLDIARMEEHRPELHPVSVTLDSLIEEAVRTIGYLAAERRIRFVREIPPGLPELMVDRSMVARVMVNLISNAVKFTPAGGTITVGARTDLPGCVAVTIADTGEGIPPEYHDQIFEKFGQVASRQGGRSMSTGLGLTFCKLAVEAHGGRIGVDSRPGEGARFTFTLPAQSRSETSAA